MNNKTRGNIKNKTHKKRSSKGWAQKSPGTRERRIMKEDCGSKCFLGPIGESSFPICNKGTCNINPKGIYAAFVRARQYSSKTKNTKNTKHTNYRKIATRAKKMLKKRGYYN